RTTAETWEALKRTEASSLYDAARFRAVLAGVIRARSQSDGDAKDAAAEAERAMSWLQRAAAAGLNDVHRMNEDGDLNALRDRDDFKALINEIRGPNVPQSN